MKIYETKTSLPQQLPEATPGDILPIDVLTKENVICGIVIIGFTLSVIYHYLAAYIMGHNFYPYNTFLSPLAERFADYYNLYNASKELTPCIIRGFNLPPFPILFMHIFTFIKPLYLLILITILSYMFYLTMFYQNLRNQNNLARILITFILAFMSFPILYSIDRGSTEIWVFVSLALFTYFYLKGLTYTSVFFLSFAIAFNFYSSIFAILFLIDKKYVQFFIAGFSSLLIIIGSASLLKGGVGVTFSNWGQNTSHINPAYLASAPGSLKHSISLYTPLQLLFGDNFLFGKFYIILAFVLFVLLVIFLYKSSLCKWKTITLLMIAFIILPQASFDSQLVFIFIPVMLFINSKENLKSDFLFASLFGILLVPKSYFIFSSVVSLSVVINPTLLLSIIFLLVYDYFKMMTENRPVKTDLQ